MDLVKDWTLWARKIRLTLYQVAEFHKERIKESLLLKSWDFWMKEFGFTLSSTWLNFRSPWSLFFSSWIKEKISLHLKFKLHSSWPILMGENRTLHEREGARFLVGIVAEFWVPHVKRSFDFSRKNKLNLKRKCFHK